MKSSLEKNAIEAIEMDSAHNEEKSVVAERFIRTLKNKSDDDEDDELFFVVWLTDERRLALFPDGTIVRDPHHRESPTRREQGLNQCRT